MARAYYSTIFQQAAPEIWKIIRDFNNYPVWVGGAGESRIEDGKPGETVGCVREVLHQGRCIRQRLLALSDLERTQVYAFCGAPPLPMPTSRRACASSPSSMATAPLSNGGRHSTASPTAARRSPRP